ncbi:MAG: KEOPS complex N(6)-L-threonylcarbamoyladenine synthase Kae1 [Candidatus Micrarchaeaceae archaeon]
MDDCVAGVERMITIGIESSAHTFGVGIVENGRIIANSKSMYPISDKGIIPMKVADFHQKNSARVISEAMQQAGIGLEDIDAIGYTKGPGIGPCLRVGQLAALVLARRTGKPIYPVNHAVAHIEITKHIYGLGDPLALYVSGGNSQILALEAEPYPHYHVLGETFDIGVGNMLDSFARAAGLNPAWGSSVAKLAEGGRYVRMPYTVKGMDFTFTGLLTSAIRMLPMHRKEDVAFSLQETAFSMLCEAAERALLLSGKKELIVCGGVAQSKRLADMLQLMAKAHGRKFYVAPNEFNSDNGAMIAIIAWKMHSAGGKVPRGSISISQRYRAQNFRLVWIKQKRRT